MPNERQLKEALGALMGAAPKAPRKTPTLKVNAPERASEELTEGPPRGMSQESWDELNAELGEADDEVLTWEDMEIQKAKEEYDAIPVEEQIAAITKNEEYTRTIDRAQDVFNHADQVYGGKNIVLPTTIKDPTPLKVAVGPAYESLHHFSDEAISKMSVLANDAGRGRVYITSISDLGASAVLSSKAVRGNPLIGNPRAMGDAMNDYDFYRGFDDIPSLDAAVDKNGDVIISGLGDNPEAWNSLVLLSGNTFAIGKSKQFPVAIKFSKPLFDSPKLSGKVFAISPATSNRMPVSGLSLDSVKVEKPPARVRKGVVDPTTVEWMDLPLTTVDPETKVRTVFAPETQRIGVSINLDSVGDKHDIQMYKDILWPEHGRNPKTDYRQLKEAEESTKSYWPRLPDGTPWLDYVAPPGSSARKAIEAYTKNSVYKANIADPSAPKNAPMIISRGIEGPQLVDEVKGADPLLVADPKSARELGINGGSLHQGGQFALKNFIPDSTMSNPDRISFLDRYYKIRDVGDKLVANVINTKPELTRTWQDFVGAIMKETMWGERRMADTHDPNVFLRYRPGHARIKQSVRSLAVLPEFRPIWEAFEKHLRGSQELYVDRIIQQALSSLHGLNADIYMFVVNWKAPLVMMDQGGFSVRRGLNQLMFRKEFRSEMNELTEAMTYADTTTPFTGGAPNSPTFSSIANTMFWDIISRKGYDHVLYTNVIEYAGTPSVIGGPISPMRPIESFGIDGEITRLLAAGPIALAVAGEVLEQMGKDGENEGEESPTDTTET